MILTGVSGRCPSLFNSSKIHILHLKQFRTTPNAHIIPVRLVLFPAKAMLKFLLFNKSQTYTSKPKHHLTQEHHRTTKALTSILSFSDFTNSFHTSLYANHYRKLNPNSKIIILKACYYSSFRNLTFSLIHLSGQAIHLSSPSLLLKAHL